MNIPAKEGAKKMYSIQVTGFGLKLRTEGSLTDAEGDDWVKLYLQKLDEVVRRGKPFGQYVDMRGAKLLPPDFQKKLTVTMAKFKESGGARSVVIMDTSTGAMQIRRLARESGVYSYERYLDAETTPNFERVGLAWIIDGKDPDLKIT